MKKKYIPYDFGKCATPGCANKAIRVNGHCRKCRRTLGLEKKPLTA